MELSCWNKYKTQVHRGESKNIVRVIPVVQPWPRWEGFWETIFPVRSRVYWVLMSSSAVFVVRTTCTEWWKQMFIRRLNAKNFCNLSKSVFLIRRIFHRFRIVLVGWPQGANQPAKSVVHGEIRAIRPAGQALHPGQRDTPGPAGGLRGCSTHLYPVRAQDRRIGHIRGRWPLTAQREQQPIQRHTCRLPD